MRALTLTGIRRSLRGGGRRPRRSWLIRKTYARHQDRRSRIGGASRSSNGRCGARTCAGRDASAVGAVKKARGDLTLHDRGENYIDAHRPRIGTTQRLRIWLIALSDTERGGDECVERCLTGAAGHARSISPALAGGVRVRYFPNSVATPGSALRHCVI